MGKVFLSVIIPCFDEMANLQKGVLDKVNNFLEEKEYTSEVIIVDDGSGDGSIDFIKHFLKTHHSFRLLANQHLGKAGAVTAGVLEAKGEYILFTDMDQATPIEEVDKLLNFGRDFEIVIGSRDNRRRGAPWTRLLMARANMFLRRFIIGLSDIKDTQCGFKLFKKEPAKKLFAKINVLHNGFKTIAGSSVASGFDVELLFLAQKMGYKIKEVPVSWLHVETRRVNLVNDSLNGFWDLVKIKINSLKGLY